MEHERMTTRLTVKHLAIATAIACGIEILSAIIFFAGRPFGPWSAFAGAVTLIHIPAILLVVWPLHALGFRGDWLVVVALAAQCIFWLVLILGCIKLLGRLRHLRVDL